MFFDQKNCGKTFCHNILPQKILSKFRQSNRSNFVKLELKQRNLWRILNDFFWSKILWQNVLPQGLPHKKLTIKQQKAASFWTHGLHLQLSKFLLNSELDFVTGPKLGHLHYTMNLEFHHFDWHWNALKYHVGQYLLSEFHSVGLSQIWTWLQVLIYSSRTAPKPLQQVSNYVVSLAGIRKCDPAFTRASWLVLFTNRLYTQRIKNKSRGFQNTQVFFLILIHYAGKNTSRKTR